MHQPPANPYASPPPVPRAAASANPYAAPTARVDDAPVEGVVKADRVTRLGAAILDFLAMGVPAGVLGVVFAAAIPQSGTDDPETLMAIFGLLLFGVMGAVGIVNLVLLHRNGQTIGKKIVNIKIVRTDGSPCALLRIVFARWLPMVVIGMVPLLGPIVSLVDVLLIFREDMRCMHDHIADTIVVRA